MNKRIEPVLGDYAAALANDPHAATPPFYTDPELGDIDALEIEDDD